MEHIINFPSGRFQARISYSDGKVTPCFWMIWRICFGVGCVISVMAFP